MCRALSHCQTYIMEFLVQILNGFYLLTIFMDVWKGPKHADEITFQKNTNRKPKKWDNWKRLVGYFKSSRKFSVNFGSSISALKSYKMLQ